MRAVRGVQGREHGSRASSADRRTAAAASRAANPAPERPAGRAPGPAARIFALKPRALIPAARMLISRTWFRILGQWLRRAMSCPVAGRGHRRSWSWPGTAPRTCCAGSSTSGTDPGMPGPSRFPAPDSCELRDSRSCSAKGRAWMDSRNRLRLAMVGLRGLLPLSAEVLNAATAVYAFGRASQARNEIETELRFLYGETRPTVIAILASRVGPLGSGTQRRQLRWHRPSPH